MPVIFRRQLRCANFRHLYVRRLPGRRRVFGYAGSKTDVGSWILLGFQALVGRFRSLRLFPLQLPFLAPLSPF